MTMRVGRAGVGVGEGIKMTVGVEGVGRGVGVGVGVLVGGILVTVGEGRPGFSEKTCFFGVEVGVGGGATRRELT